MLSMRSVLPAEGAKLLALQTVGILLLVLACRIVPAFTLGTC